MNSKKVTKKALSALLASTLVFSLMPTSALVAQAEIVTPGPKPLPGQKPLKIEGAKDILKQPKPQETTKDRFKKLPQGVKKTVEKDSNDEIKNETEKQVVKEHKAKEVDKEKFADPSVIQNEVNEFLQAVATNPDPASFIGMYLGGAINRGLFALGQGLLDNIGSAFFGGSFCNKEVTANQVAFLLTELDEKAKVVAAESRDLVDLIKVEAKGSIINDFNAHVNKARGLMVALEGQYKEISLCNDAELKASLIAKMNVERERTINLLLTEKAHIDTYILGQSTLSKNNIFQVFDDYADSKYALYSDSYDVKSKFRLQVATLMCNMAKYAAIPAGDNRHLSPFAGQLEIIKNNDKAVSSILAANLPQKVKKNLHFNKVGKDAEIASMYVRHKYNNSKKRSEDGDGFFFDLEGFNEDHTKFRYFSKGRNIQTPIGLRYYVEFYTAKDKNYLIGENFGQKFITASEFKSALSKKPANMKTSEWIERAAGLKKGECPSAIILDEKVTTEGFTMGDVFHYFEYYVFNPYKDKYGTVTVSINEPPKGENKKSWDVSFHYKEEGAKLRSDYPEDFLEKDLYKPYQSNFFDKARILKKLN